ADRQLDPHEANNHLGHHTAHTNRDIIVGKVDHVVRDMDRVSIRYFINDALTADAGSYGIPVADPGASTTDVRIQSLLGTYTHSFSSSLLKSFMLSLIQWNFV